MILILIGLTIAIFVPIVHAGCLAYRDVRRWDKHHDLREKYEPLMDRAENADEYEALWRFFNQECDKRER